ncbi:MAG: hypothetical protein JWO81_562 [Alphaproteobacteria bacterium]|nr:hypothetical protein [Alphaproteobacteria bacterium]
MKMLHYVWARLGEPSTHAGIAGVLAGLAQFNPTICWLAAFEGSLAFLLKESGAAPAPSDPR